MSGQPTCQNTCPQSNQHLPTMKLMDLAWEYVHWQEWASEMDDLKVGWKAVAMVVCIHKRNKDRRREKK